MVDIRNEKDESLLEYPNLERIFKYLNWQIRYGRCACAGESKEKLLDERNNLLPIAKEMDLRDLRILYYVRLCRNTR